MTPRASLLTSNLRPGSSGKRGERLATENTTRYVRYSRAGQTSYGILEGQTVRRLDGDLFKERLTEETLPLASVKLEVPVDPDRVQKVFGVGGNFPFPGRPPRLSVHPRLFAKFACNLVPNGADIEMPPECAYLHHQGELVVVIGRQGRYIPRERVGEYVFGVSAGNDVSNESWYGEPKGLEEPSRLISKACDTWAPLGPAIVRGLDYRDLRIQVRLDGEVVADGRTSEMIDSVERIVAYASVYMTLMPGDLIYMGSPPWLPDRREMYVGQTCEVEIEGIGLLRNRVVAMKGG